MSGSASPFARPACALQATGLGTPLTLRAGGPTAAALPLSAGAAAAASAAGRHAVRWHWQHGPIDLIIGAEGEPGAVHSATRQAWALFDGLLAELVRELPVLRQAARPVPSLAQRRPGAPEQDHSAAAQAGALTGPVARRMQQVCQALADGRFITPMAAVAGAVAEAVLAPFERPGILRAWVNNGGDTAWWLMPGESLQVGVAEDRPRAGGADLRTAFSVQASDPVRGLATSGWGGRSFSLGIADRVTVLAPRAAEADALATLIANAVNTQHPGIVRQPACILRDDSDLGEQLVTVAVPALPAVAVDAALRAGLALALQFQQEGRLHAALLHCQGCSVRLDPPAAPSAQTPGAPRLRRGLAPDGFSTCYTQPAAMPSRLSTRVPSALPSALPPLQPCH